MTVSKKTCQAGTRVGFFLDVDGTLIEIACTPKDVAVDSSVLAALTNLRDALGGALALVSGRPLTNPDRFFAPLRLPSWDFTGSSGRNSDGKPSPFPR